jgi:hypothetical protein
MECVTILSGAYQTTPGSGDYTAVRIAQPVDFCLEFNSHHDITGLVPPLLLEAPKRAVKL